jgi:hypothetical protein
MCVQLGDIVYEKDLYASQYPSCGDGGFTFSPSSFPSVHSWTALPRLNAACSPGKSGIGPCPCAQTREKLHGDVKSGRSRAIRRARRRQ